jgi:hypothetical protein
MIEIVSIHIPKTAGRSFLSILNTVYDSNIIEHFDRKNYNNKGFPEIEQFKSQLNSTTKIIHGHFHYNEIKNLNNINNAKVITWLREPVDRVISNFSFFKKRIFESSNDVELQNRREETLIEYASMENSRNRMSKFTQGLDIEKYYFVGITEHFNSEVGILAGMLKWKPFEIPRININTEFKSKLPSVSDKEKKIIEELNGNDMELYFRALEIRKKRFN